MPYRLAIALGLCKKICHAPLKKRTDLSPPDKSGNVAKMTAGRDLSPYSVVHLRDLAFRRPQIVFPTTSLYCSRLPFPAPQLFSVFKVRGKF